MTLVIFGQSIYLYSIGLILHSGLSVDIFYTSYHDLSCREQEATRCDDL
jgi:hypothetical protein